jgi:hypothetical protein
MMKPVPAAAIACNSPSVAIALAVTNEVSRRLRYASTKPPVQTGVPSVGDGNRALYDQPGSLVAELAADLHKRRPRSRCSSVRG